MTKIEISNRSSKGLVTQLLVIPISAKELKARKTRGGALAEFDGESRSMIQSLLRRQGFKAKNLETLLIPLLIKRGAQWLLLVGWEDENESDFATLANYRALGSTIVEHAKKALARSVHLVAHNLNLNDKKKLMGLLEGVHLSQYSFRKYKSKGETLFKVEKVCLLSRGKIARGALAEAQILCEATALARDFVNTPARDCTPTYLVNRCREISKKGRLKLTVFNKQALRRMKANALLAVAQGSDEAPYLIRLRYKPRSKTKRSLAIVGKGVTFDSGGLSIKPGSGMETMKCDMSGAAAVMATMYAVSKLKPALAVTAYIPTVENMINGRATRPGDIVRAMSGKSIEILNTDAEGRLILADALTLAVRDGCNPIIDIATLTGGCVVALGKDYAGLFATTDRLAHKIEAAGILSGERVWRLPLAPEYKSALVSSVADIKNIAGPGGSAITGALFLKEFIPKQTEWAHLDIAGPAFTESEKGHIKKGGVGFGVRMLTRMLLDY